MGGNRRDKRMSLRRNVVFCILGFILAVAAFMIASRYEDASRVQERGVSTANIGVHERIEHNGKTYVEETGITTILIMGIDGSSESERYG
ncbi:MAG: hypothetical protein IJC48_03800, partial [Clostridia bacterium]|nr:hypothetical protein [Clostridia bacterium]